jgi:hypothetical protein
MAIARRRLDRGDLVEQPIECRRHQLVHPRRIVAFDKMRLVTVADKQRF